MDIDDLAALRLQLDWGVDDALMDTPIDRFLPAPARPGPVAHPAAATPPRPIRTPVASGQTLAIQAAAAAHDLPALHAALDAFTTCPLRATATTTVAPSGNPAAGLVLIGEAPGPDDDRAGRTFSGPTGDRIDRILRTVALTRDDLMMALMVPWRPPGGRPVNEAELALCLPFLHRMLALLRPRRLVLMGAGPYRALTNDEAGFRKARGKWTGVAITGLDTPIPTLPILSPDIWLGSATNKQTLWTDLLTLRTTLDGPGDAAR